MSKKNKNSSENVEIAASVEAADDMPTQLYVTKKFRFSVQLSPKLPSVVQIFKPGVIVTNKNLIKQMLDAKMPVEVVG